MKRMVFTFALLCCFYCPTYAQRRTLNHLKTWANEVPLNYKAPRRDFYALPEIKTRLLKLLGPVKYKLIYEMSELTSPIDIIDGYLIAKGYQRGGGHVIVAVRLYDGFMRVGFFPTDNPPEWHGAVTSGRDVPPCALEQ